LLIPYIPVFLPILLFCRHTELKLRLWAFRDLGDTSKLEMWNSLIEEKLLVRSTANDIKIIEMVSESFGQLIVTCLLIVRFHWLVEKDYKSFGINFETYIIITMTISFLTMIHAIYKYHNRHRRSLRPMASMATPVLLLTWSLMITMKVFVYVISFINTPGLFFIPVLLKILVSLLLFQICGFFREIRNHEKFIYLLISFMVPTSLPSEKFKSMRKLYIINFSLYFIECTGVLIFSAVMKYYYHNQLYCRFYEELPSLIFGDTFTIITTFNHLLLLLFGLVTAVTVLSALLMWLYTNYLHPRIRLFDREFTKEKVQVEVLRDLNNKRKVENPGENHQDTKKAASHNFKPSNNGQMCPIMNHNIASNYQKQVMNYKDPQVYLETSL
jgi:hypothetical protein